MVPRPYVAAALVAALACAARPALAQQAPIAPMCRSGSTQLEDACQKATDIFGFMVPQLGLALAGGSALPGDPDGTPGARRFAVASRLTTVLADVPSLDLEMPEAGEATRTSYLTRALPLPAPALDAALGLGERIRLGPITLPGADLLASFAYVPAIATRDVAVAPSGRSWRIGLGARVGLVAEGPRVPGISVSWQQRMLPALDIAATSLASDDTLGVRDFSVQAQAWRVTAQRTGARGAAWLSAGGDRYLASGRLAPVVREDGRRYPDEGSPPDGYLLLLSRTMQRANLSAGASWRLGHVQLTAEGGMASGGELRTYNEFGGRKANDVRYYGSFGLRVD